MFQATKVLTSVLALAALGLSSGQVSADSNLREGLAARTAIPYLTKLPTPKAKLTSTDFTYSQTQAGYLSIHPMDMVPDGNPSAVNYYVDYGLSRLSTTSPSACFNTGVNLPRGATISAVVVWYSSNNQSNPAVNLLKTPLATGGTTPLLSQSIASDAGTRTLAYFALPASPNNVVDNAQNAYGFAICIGTGTTFHGARIDYHYTSAGD